jgi:hypothetical protein
MKRKLLIFLLALPAFLVAGAWTELGVSQARSAAGHNFLAVIFGYASALFVKAVTLASQVTEQAYFFGLGACFIVLALALHRKRAKPQSD